MTCSDKGFNTQNVFMQNFVFSFLCHCAVVYSVHKHGELV